MAKSSHKEIIKLIIAGSRKFNDYHFLCEVCDSLMENISFQNSYWVVNLDNYFKIAIDNKQILKNQGYNEMNKDGN